MNHGFLAGHPIALADLVVLLGELFDLFVGLRVNQRELFAFHHAQAEFGNVGFHHVAAAEDDQGECLRQ